jgi:serine protease Do
MSRSSCTSSLVASAFRRKVGAGVVLPPKGGSHEFSDFHESSNVHEFSNSHGFSIFQRFFIRHMSRNVLMLAGFGLLVVASPSVAGPPARAPQKSTDPLRLASGSIESLVQRVARSVVQVVVSGYQPVDSGGRADVALGRGRVIGSGMVVEAPGYVLTNAHVVAGAERIQVVVEGDGAQTLGHQTARVIDAQLVGVSDELDLALLKIDADDIPVLHFANYDQVRQGELVFAFGSPDGLRNSVSMGMVSSVARQVAVDSPLVYVQTDASINPGNSGGPLVDAAGDVVGINTFIQTLSGGSEGLGFALPSALIALAYPQLKEFGHLHRGLIGLTVQSVTPLMAAGLQLPAGAALIAANVASGSPAGQAGLRPGDVIAAIDGTPVANLTLAQLYVRLYGLRGGQAVKIAAQRGSDAVTVSATAIEIPHVCDRQGFLDVRTALIEPLGILATSRDTFEEAPASNDDGAAAGVVVSARVETGKRSDVSLERGDVIRAVNGDAVATPAALRDAVERVPLRGAIVLQVERDGRLEYVAFERE